MKYDGPNEKLLSTLLSVPPITGTESMYGTLLQASLWIGFFEGPDGQRGTMMMADRWVPAYTHQEFLYVAADQPKPNLQSIRFQELCRWARDNAMNGIHINPGHYAFGVSRVVVDLLADGLIPFDQDVSFATDRLVGIKDAGKEFFPPVMERLRACALSASLNELKVGTMHFEWQGDLPAVFYSPYPSPEFEVSVAETWSAAGYESLPRSAALDDFSIPGEPLYVVQRALKFDPDEADVVLFPADVSVQVRPYDGGFSEAMCRDLRRVAAEVGLEELDAVNLQFGDLPSRAALAYRPFPHDRFAKRYRELHHAHGMGAVNIPLVPLSQFQDSVLERLGKRLYRSEPMS